MKRVTVIFLFGAAVTLVVLVLLNHKSSQSRVAGYPDSPSPGRLLAANTPLSQNSIAPFSQNSNTPTLQRSIASATQAATTPPLHYSTTPLRPSPPPSFTAFSEWADRFFSRSGPVSNFQGEALVWKCREAMLELIQTDPQ